MVWYGPVQVRHGGMWTRPYHGKLPLGKSNPSPSQVSFRHYDELIGAEIAVPATVNTALLQLCQE